MQLRQSGLASSRHVKSKLGQCKPISGSSALKQLFLQCIISRPRAYILQTAEASCDACSGLCNKLPSQINKVLHDDFSYKPSKCNQTPKSIPIPIRIPEPSLFFCLLLSTLLTLGRTTGGGGRRDTRGSGWGRRAILAGFDGFDIIKRLVLRVR